MDALHPDIQLWLDLDESREIVSRREGGLWWVELVCDDSSQDVLVCGEGVGRSLYEASRDAGAAAIAADVLRVAVLT